MSNIFSKIFAFLGGTALVRILTQNSYGLYVYVLNSISILYLLCDFGASNALLQYLLENKNNIKKQVAFANLALKILLFASGISAVLILFSPLFYPFTIREAKVLTPILFLLPILSNFNLFIPMILRSNLQNQRYALFQVVSTAFNYVFLIIFAYTWGVIGALISVYVFNLLTLILGIYLIKDSLSKFKTYQESKITKQEKKEFFGFALFTQLNNTIGGLLLIVDTFLVGLLMAESTSVAIYKVASSIPINLAFIPTSVVIYISPYFIKNNKNIEWIKRNFKKMIFNGIFIYGIMSVGLILFGKIVISTLFGVKYLPGLSTYIILIVGFFVSATFKIPVSNVIYTMKKVKVNLVVNITSIIINIILNVFFIKKWGFMGAALSTTLIHVITSIIYMVYVLILFKQKGNKQNV